MGLDWAPDEGAKTILVEQAGTLYKEQTGPFVSQGAFGARRGPRFRANWLLEQGGLINNQRARLETMGPWS